jgi:hypothetical protein
MSEVLGVTAWYGSSKTDLHKKSETIEKYCCLLRLTQHFNCLFAQIILDVPTVGGRLMLVDMAGSENIDQAGQSGFEAKMQVNFWEFIFPLFCVLALKRKADFVFLWK